MSIRVMSWLWTNSPARGPELLMLLALADFANDAGRNAYPSMDTLAEKCRSSRRAAQRTIGRLVELGWLEIEAEGGGRGRANRYRIIMETASPTTPFDDDETTSSTTPFAEERVSSEAVKGGLHDTRYVKNRNTPQPPASGGRRCQKHKRPKDYCDACQQPALKALVPWCGQCDTDATRLIELPSGRVTHCPRCHPKVAS